MALAGHACDGFIAEEHNLQIFFAPRGATRRSCCKTHTAAHGQVETLVRSCSERAHRRARSKNVTPDPVRRQVDHGGDGGALPVDSRVRHSVELGRSWVAWASHAIATGPAGFGKKYDLPLQALRARHDLHCLVVLAHLHLRSTSLPCSSSCTTISRSTSALMSGRTLQLNISEKPSWQR